MAQEHESQEQEVTAQDQGHINEFSRLNVKYHELEEDLRGKEEVLVNLQDSSNEVREEAAAVLTNILLLAKICCFYAV
jgi:hypothetical protein